MIKIGDYCIQEYPKQHKIVISLPQTMTTATSTCIPIADRKEKLETEELLDILQFVMGVYLSKNLKYELKEYKEEKSDRMKIENPTFKRDKTTGKAKLFTYYENPFETLGTLQNECKMYTDSEAIYQMLLKEHDRKIYQQGKDDMKKNIIKNIRKYS